MDIERTVIDALKQAVVDETLSSYLNMISSKNPSEVKNADWRRFLEMVKRDQDDSSSSPVSPLPTVLRQVILDTLAATLAAFDGTLRLEGLKGDFRLLYDGSPLPQTLNDTLWESEE